ncbi:MAG: DUF1064 domain-containing protein [Butyrivibrio sp.]|nr:DUF1064 domain-containing protein [Butyrivibrio sp.]
MTAWRNFHYSNKSKYHSKKIEEDGQRFDSKKEARRYKELLLMEQAGEIQNLQRQVKYVLIPAQREPDTVGKRGGIKKGRVIERECDYFADFVYTKADTGETVVEDTKGMRLPTYIIKRKLMLERHGIRIKEI